MVIAAMTASSLMCFIKLFVFNVKIMISQPLPFRFCLWAGKRERMLQIKELFRAWQHGIENVSTMKREKMRADLSCSPKRIFHIRIFHVTKIRIGKILFGSHTKVSTTCSVRRRGRGDIPQPRCSIVRCEPCRDGRVRHRQGWSRLSPRNRRWRSAASPRGCRSTSCHL